MRLELTTLSSGVLCSSNQASQMPQYFILFFLWLNKYSLLWKTDKYHCVSFYPDEVIEPFHSTDVSFWLIMETLSSIGGASIS